MEHDESKVLDAAAPADATEPVFPVFTGLGWALEEENGDVDRALQWLLLAGKLRSDTVRALTKAYEPTLLHFVTAEVIGELVRVREDLLKAAAPRRTPGQSSAAAGAVRIDPNTARDRVLKLLASNFGSGEAAFHLALEVLTICTIRTWKEIERVRGQGYIARFPEFMRRAAHIPPESVYSDLFVEISGPLFQRAVSEFAAKVVESLNVRAGPLERVEDYLGLRPDPNGPEQLPSSNPHDVSGPVT